MKKIIVTSLITVSLLVTSTCSFAENTKPNPSPKIKKVINERKQKHDKRRGLIKKDKDFKVLVDNGGLFAFTNADGVINDSKFEKKLKNIEAQSSLTGRSVIYLDKGKKSKGYLEVRIDDDYDLDWFGDDEINISGTGLYQWFKESGTYKTWDKLTGCKDIFEITYKQVDEYYEVNTGFSVGTDSSISGGATIGQAVTKTKATCELEWPDDSKHVYYEKNYDNLYVETNEIKRYGHISQGIATVGGKRLAGYLYKYKNL
jgi:hypothetical protein